MLQSVVEVSLTAAILISVVIGILCAFVLYWKGKHKRGGLIDTILFALRAASVSIVVMLLFNPYIKTTNTIEEQPIVIALYDNSASMKMSGDADKVTDFATHFGASVSKQFRTDEYAFGETVSKLDSLPFDSKFTDIGLALKHIEKQYTNKNVGAVVLVSDGISNTGRAVETCLDGYPFKVNTLLCGDTASHADLAISKTHHNKSVSTNSIFKVTVAVAARNCKGRTALLSVSEDGKTIASERIAINTKNFSKNIDFEFDSGDKECVRQFDFGISGIEGERQTLNNRKRVFISVYDRKSKILFYAKAPHPDLGAIANALDNHYATEFVYAKDPIPDFSRYDLVVLHNMPCRDIERKAIEQAESNDKTPLFAIVGAATDLDQLNKMQSTVQVFHGTTSKNFDARCLFDESFTLFTLNDNTKASINTFPPLAVPHLETKFIADCQTMLRQEIMNVETGPALCLGKEANRKTAFLFGTGIWKWRLHDYRSNGSHELFDELATKTIGYLLSDSDDNLIILHNTEYYADEPIHINAELTNASGEHVNEADLRLTLNCKTNGKTYDYIFSRAGDAYELNMGVLPEGIYTFGATADMKGQPYSTRGQFSVLQATAEAANLKADQQLMQFIALSTGGQAFGIDNAADLKEHMLSDNTIAVAKHIEPRYTELIDYRNLLIVLIILFSAEWVLRKIYRIY